MSGSTRRGLLGGAAVLAVAPVAPAMSAHPHPDRELIAVCAEFDAIERAAQLPARSPEGLRAKAALLLLHIRTEQDHTALAASLARDVTGRAGA